jgi:hypothetical protein
MGSARPLRFAFALDGSIAAHDCAEMSVTYMGRFNRKTAEADARRRFEEWRNTGNSITRRRSADQVVLA